MTPAAADGKPPPGDLTARVFRALYPDFDLHALAGTYLALPKGTPCFTASGIGEIARQISGLSSRPPEPDALHGSSDQRQS